MRNARLAIVLAACYALLAPGVSPAQTWTQIKNASVDVDAMNTPLTATNIPMSGKDNIDVYATWGDDTTPRVASCGPVVNTTCPTFTGWVKINTLSGFNFGTESAVGWGTTPSNAHRAVFVTAQDVEYATRDGNQAWSHWTSLGTPPANGPCLLSGPQAISQAKNMISVFLVGADCNLWINYFPKQGTTNSWSGWLNLTVGPGSPLSNNIQSVGSQGSSMAVVYSNLNTGNPKQTALNQIHVLVVDNSQNVWDVNYYDDATIDYDPDPTTGSWSLTDTNVTVEPNSGGWNAIGAAVSPPQAIAVFADQGTVSSTAGFQAPLLGQQLIEEDGSLPSTTGAITVNGPFEDDDDFLAAPVPVTFGKQDANCNSSRACKNAVFFITDIPGGPNGNTKGGNIRYSIWGVDVPADAWNLTVGTNGIKMVGTASDVFNANPAAVVSQDGATVYVFAARTNPTLCVQSGDDCGSVYYARFTP